MNKYIFFLFWFTISINSIAQSTAGSDSCEAALMHSYNWNFKAAAIAFESCLAAAKDSYHKGNNSLNVGLMWAQLKEYEKAKKYYSLAAANYALAKSELITAGTAKKHLLRNKLKQVK
jgi:hypothetical protein